LTRIGIIGGGNISETHARAALEIDGVEISAVYGRNTTRVARLAELFGGVSYLSLEDFLNHKPMDIVIIGSPSGLHAEQGIAAAQRGLHVLVEKPIDIATAQADKLILACEQAGVKLGVCFQDRFSPDIDRVKQLIDSGQLGKPILVSGSVRWYRPPEYYSSSRWRGTPALDGGGALINQAIHTVDLLLWLMGDVKRVYSAKRTALHQIEVEDTLAGTLEFSNGAIGTIEAATSVYPGYDRRIELTGTEGTIVIEQDRMARCDLKTGSPAYAASIERSINLRTSSPVVSDVSGHRRVISDFLQAIETDSHARCDGADGRRSIALVEAIYESAQTSRPVVLGGLR
jgi:UDP-N-acetyl-2-amino-2-deoxyglucuronate dehydrogenase